MADTLFLSRPWLFVEIFSKQRGRNIANAFSRCRKLPLPSLLAVMLSGMRKCIQAALDEFFAHLQQQAQLVRHVLERAFSRARARLPLLPSQASTTGSSA